ncbi:MFS transporter [Leifsonia sp. Root112D2]|uniref:MFS transporter n=1 Tax=Leifsonia sp. Root112D2 TaxID=1736426 RepID=UPI0007023469|nr:MFS transporter [Leifsonia sp. Root112D2]KQV06676.1 MFS transporter [Leifsonia sp. Root112D2]
MSSTTAGAGSAKATFVAAYIAVTLAQITNAFPGALNGQFAAEFHTSGAGLTWISSIFVIAIVVFELTFGVLGDLFGRKKLLYAGAGFIFIGTLVAGFATTTGIMILGQAIGGIGAGVLFPISLSMIAAITPDLRARSRVIATWAGFLSLGAVISPVVAGIAVQLFTVPGATAGAPNAFSGWRVTYYFAAAIAVIVFLIALRSKDSSAPEGRKLDIPGQVTLALGLIAALCATVQAVDAGFGAPEVIAGYVIGAVLLVAFVIIELKAKVPLIHLSLFKNPSYAITSIVAVTGMFAFLAIAFSTSVAVGALGGVETWMMAVLFVFIQGPAFLLIPVVGWLIHRVSPRWMLTAGFLLMAACGYWMASLHLGTPQAFGGTPWTAFIIPLFLLGIGFALTVGSITAVAINTVEPNYIGMASATTNLLRDLGFALGPVVGSAIAFSVGAAIFAPQLGGVLTGAALPPEAVAGLSHVPPLGFLSGWEGVIAQFSAGMHAGGAPQQAIDAAAAALAQSKGSIQGAAGVSLGSGFQMVYMIAGIAATASAALTLFISGRKADVPVTEAELEETITDEVVA